MQHSLTLGLVLVTAPGRLARDHVHQLLRTDTPLPWTTPSFRYRLPRTL